MDHLLAGRARTVLIVVLLATPLLGGAWLWLRNSPLVAVHQVRISGVRGPEAAGIETALRGAARRMSTLDVRLGALRAAVAPFPVVKDLRVSSSIPHGLRIHVIEQPPVAALVVGGVRTAVAADGAVLGPPLLSSSLAVIHATGPEPLLRGSVRGEMVRAELGVLGAAPRALAGWVARVFTGHEGLTVEMRNGLDLYFGDGTQPHAKWLSAARVLADPGAAGASYVDVRLPTRPAAGMGAAGGPEGTSSQSATEVSASDPTAAALASTLAEAVKGAPQTPASAPESAASPPAAAASAPSTAASAPSTAASAPSTAASTVESPAANAPTEEASPSTSG